MIKVNQKITAASKQAFDDISSDPSPPSTSSEPVSSALTSQFSLNDFISRKIGQSIQTSTEISSLEQRIRNIANQSRKDADQKGFSVIDHWAKQRFEDPELWKLVQVILGAAPTQCSVERDFSQYNLVFTKSRNRISAANLENILKIRSNKSIIPKALARSLANDTE